MKRTFILLFALISLNMAYGQDKEVAVLNPKTLSGTVPNNDKLIIVSSMKKAFTQIDGYKAFTRSSQALIDAEAEFQRSGKVSEASIKKVGEQNGAAFICTFTLSLEKNELVVNSDIIDVESGEIMNSDFIALLDRTDRNDVMEQCQTLAYALLGASHSDGNVKQPIAKPNAGNKQSGKTGDKNNGSIYSPDGIDMVYVEGTGSGLMAKPGFYIGKYEVTQSQWKVVMGSNPSKFKAPNNPVETVSWDDVKTFISKLNAMTNRNYRLPTESEWVYAAQEGNKNSSYEYSGSNTLGDVAWYDGNSGQTTHPVGQKQPNALGIFDMTGNVWEWCEDCYDSSCSSRVNRGGSWRNGATSSRVSNRYFDAPSNRFSYLGFRLVLPL